MIIMLSATDTEDLMLRDDERQRKKQRDEQILQPIIRFILKYNVKSVNLDLPGHSWKIIFGFKFANMNLAYEKDAFQLGDKR